MEGEGGGCKGGGRWHTYVSSALHCLTINTHAPEGRRRHYTGGRGGKTGDRGWEGGGGASTPTHVISGSHVATGREYEMHAINTINTIRGMKHPRDEKNQQQPLQSSAIDPPRPNGYVTEIHTGQVYILRVCTYICTYIYAVAL